MPTPGALPGPKPAPNPVRSFVNLVAVASMIGLVLWREHYWRVQVKTLQQSGLATSSGATAAPVSVSREAELLTANNALQSQLVSAEGRLSLLTQEVDRLKQSIEAAKPPPTPESLAQQFAQLRGMAFEPAPQWMPVPLDTILEKVKTQVESHLPLTAAQARARAAVAMGFHSDPFDYQSAVVSLAQMNNGGFHDAAANQFLYREEASLSRADGREAFIGGLAAALASRKGGGIEKLYDTANDDAALALRSLISGDANASRVRFSLADQLNLGFDRNGAPTAPPPNYSAPVYLAELWKFSQDKGSQFIEFLSGKGGNVAVDAAYQRPPQSSAEILHPDELYFADPPFEPVAVTFGELVVGGQSPVFTNVAGEIGSYVALRSWLGVDEATLASEGWAGDRYVVWPGESDHGDHVFWNSVWRTDKDSQEFFDQMRRVLMQRFSIPWRKEYDAVPGTFQVDDPHRVIRLIHHRETRTVTLLNATGPGFVTAFEAVRSQWK